jgi:hypothetical protein
MSKAFSILDAYHPSTGSYISSKTARTCALKSCKSTKQSVPMSQCPWFIITSSIRATSRQYSCLSKASFLRMSSLIGIMQQAKLAIVALTSPFLKKSKDYSTMSSNGPRNSSRPKTFRRLPINFRFLKSENPLSFLRSKTYSYLKRPIL